MCYRVMTGLRFVKINRVIYLQIQDGYLLPHGGINATSLQWKPVNTSQLDYKMSWEKRSIDLDDLHAPEGHVMTGKLCLCCQTKNSNNRQ